MVAGEHHRDQQRQVRRRLRLRRSASCKLVAQPLPVQKVPDGREPPRTDRLLSDDSEFERPLSVHLGAGSHKHALDEGGPFVLPHRPT